MPLAAAPDTSHTANCTTQCHTPSAMRACTSQPTPWRPPQTSLRVGSCTRPATLPNCPAPSIVADAVVVVDAAPPALCGSDCEPRVAALPASHPFVQACHLSSRACTAVGESRRSLPIQWPHNRRVSTESPLAHALCLSMPALGPLRSANLVCAMYDDLTPASMCSPVSFCLTLRPPQLY
jgi:hypothetical protein